MKVVEKVDDIVCHDVDLDLSLVFRFADAAVVERDYPVSLEERYHAFPETVVGSDSGDQNHWFPFAFVLVIQLYAGQFSKHAPAILALD